MAKAAREYAKALYTSLESTDEKVKTLGLLSGLKKALSEDSRLLDQIKSKSISQEGTKKLMDSLLKSFSAGETVHNFFNLLIDKGRMELVNDLASEFENMADEEKQILRGVVKSALPLSDEKKAALEEKFGKKMEKTVVLTYEQDSKVVAGVKVEIGAFTYDDTVETHIKKIKENLNRSWS